MGEFRQLSESECRAHLVRCATGRVAVATPTGPHIIPVSYALVDEGVVFRTSPSSILATYAPGAVIAFEVERTRDALRSGWSVVARGPAARVLDHQQIERIRRVWDPQPWAEGERNVYIRLVVQELTGRSVGDQLSGTLSGSWFPTGSEGQGS